MLITKTFNTTVKVCDEKGSLGNVVISWNLLLFPPSPRGELLKNTSKSKGCTSLV